MDNSHYSSNVIHNTTTSSYPSPSSTSSQSLQQQQHASSLPPHTLPPLQPHNPIMQSAPPPYGSYPHTPRTPATPNTPGANGAMSNYPPPPTVGRAPYPGMMPNPQYQQNHQYPATSSMMPQASTSMVHPQPIAPAPSPGRVPPVLRPMPASGVPPPGMPSPYAPMAQSQMLHNNEGEQPTHVVGSQGRRGILPSAPGRPAAPPAGTGAKSVIVPQKDADGKFPCPHCNKTYLHAKHLKRHLLRHTGDRPYMCVLCRDTFSRSDILKRHFQKCSIRRGNPTGASHLSSPHAHVKKNKVMENELTPINGMGNIPDGMVHPFGLMPSSDGMQNMSNDQNHLSRQGSMNDPNDRDRRSVPGSVIGNNARTDSFNQGYNGGVPHTMAANMSSQLAGYPMQPQGQNGMPIFPGQASNQQSGGLDWSQMFQAGAQQTYVNPFPPNVGQTQIATIKRQEPNVDPGTPDGVPGGPSNLDRSHSQPHTTPIDFADRSLFFDDLSVPAGSATAAPAGRPDQDARYQQLSDRLMTFFYPPGYPESPTDAGMNLYFAPDNIKSFLGQYTHFHRHFSILHIPTFRIMDAYTGLVAGVCCIGACYSNRVSPSDVRALMNFLKSALERDSQLLASLDDGVDPEIKYAGAFGDSGNDVEQLQAIMLMQTLLIWNGTPEQRESARRLFPLIAALARRSGLLGVSQNSSAYSALHQPVLDAAALDPNNFVWSSWVEQEKRIRIMFLISLCDASMGLYFNTPALFDPLELRVPLPADDAAWDAPDGGACADALGLRGPEAAVARNPNGTRRAKQPETHLALRALLDSSYQIQPGTTNLYGKFILIHGLLALMRRAQLEGLGAIANGSSTPLPQADWLALGGQSEASWPPSGSNSGRATPVDGTMRPETLKVFATALEKFKLNWDADMAGQFNRVLAEDERTNPLRQGFSKDGVHYYWLANWMLKNTKLSDLQLPADQRFMQVMHLLKSVRSWVKSDGLKRGEELGSIGVINMEYGSQSLTLDMVNLFTPLPKVVESPGIASVKTDID